MKLDPGRVQMDDGTLELLLLRRMPDGHRPAKPHRPPSAAWTTTAPASFFRHVQRVTVTTDEDLPGRWTGSAPSAPRVELRNLPGAIPLMLCR